MSQACASANANASTAQLDPEAAAVDFDDDDDYLHDSLPDDSFSRSHYKIKISQAHGPVNLDLGGCGGGDGGGGGAGKANVTLNVNNFFNGTNLHMDSKMSAELARENLGMIMSLLGKIPYLGKGKFTLEEKEGEEEDAKDLPSREKIVLRRSDSLPDLSRSRSQLHLLSAKNLMQQNLKIRHLSPPKKKKGVSSSSATDDPVASCSEMKRRKSSRRKKRTELNIQKDGTANSSSSTSSPDSSAHQFIAEVEVTTSISRGPGVHRHQLSQTRSMRDGQWLKRFCSKSYINPIRFAVTILSLVLSVVLIYFVVIFSSVSSESFPTGQWFQ